MQRPQAEARWGAMLMVVAGGLELRVNVNEARRSMAGLHGRLAVTCWLSDSQAAHCLRAAGLWSPITTAFSCWPATQSQGLSARTKPTGWVPGCGAEGRTSRWGEA